MSLKITIPIELCRSLEKDAQERTERRREKEAAGREWKSRGAAAFKRGDMEEALDCYSKALEETPWVTTLYTNRALVSLVLEHALDYVPFTL